MGGVCPAVAYAHGDVERDIEFVGRTHLASYELFDRRRLPRCDFEHELIVYLQQQARFQPIVVKCPPHTEHRHLDDVGRTSLDRCVEGHAFGHLSSLPVVTGEVGQIAATAEDRL